MSSPTERIHHWDLQAGGRPPVGVQVFVALVAVALAFGCVSSGDQAALEAQTGATAFATEYHAPDTIVTACYDCHSNHADAVWNARLAPSYWFAGPARKDLSFTEWPNYDPEKQAEELRAIAKEVRDGAMPPWDYTLLHPAAKLTEAEKSAIVQWSSAAAPNAPN